MQEKIEKIMKRIHVFFSNCDYADDNPNKIIVPRMPMLNLLEELNEAVYGLLEQCEVTKAGREREINRHKKKMNAVVEEAENTAEDIYAASMIYTDRMLSELREMIEQAGRNIRDEYEYLNGKLAEQAEIVTSDQKDIRNHLERTKQNDKYKNIIRDYNDKVMEQRKMNDKASLAEKEADKEMKHKKLRSSDKADITYEAERPDDMADENGAEKAGDGKEVKKIASIVDISALSEAVQEDDVKKVSYEVKVNPAYYKAAGEFSTESLDAEYEQWKENDEARQEKEITVNKKSSKKKVFSKRKKEH